jgi:hypothetical protein
MRICALSTFSLALACGVVLCPGKALAKTQAAQSTGGNAVSAAAQSLAEQMVPAEAVLDKALDAKKTQPGQQFRATLTSTIQLKNGTELPRGTTLVGTIATDKMASGSGRSTLALQFTQAQIKGGKTIPIEAAIVGVAPPSSSYDSWDQGDSSDAADQWNKSELAVDQIGALSGVDLHSRIGGRNSGVFVSTKKDDMKLAARSQISLAIAAETGSGMSGAG